jgi:protocatechuate 3,4-dioxygenase beta subunit
MPEPESELTRGLSRRRFLALSAALVAPLVAGACGDDEAPAPGSAGQPAAVASPAAAGQASQAATQAATLAPTPECGDADDFTIAQTEGPYFTPNSPERTSLREAGMAGTPLTVSGYVVATDCRPVARALVDFWQCDAAGVYDNAGYQLRGHQFTGADGRYELQTIVPGLYPGRTRHIHVKVQAPSGPVLTTQLYFPGEPRNASDGIYNSALLLELKDVAGGQAGTFTFVVRT